MLLCSRQRWEGGGGGVASSCTQQRRGWEGQLQMCAWFGCARFRCAGSACARRCRMTDSVAWAEMHRPTSLPAHLPAILSTSPP
eukprot:230570-Chlamydomonas_euryale.AAC.1